VRAPDLCNLPDRVSVLKVVKVEKVVNRRLGVVLVVLLGLVGSAGATAIARGPGGARVVPLAVTASAAGVRPPDPPSPAAGVRVPPVLERPEPAKATAERFVAAVDQALGESAPGAAWTGRPDRRRPGHVYQQRRDGRLVSVTVGSPVVHQGRSGVLRVRISLDPPGSAGPGAAAFDWSCGSADRRRGAMCEASREPDGVRTKIQTSVGAGGSVRHRIDVELPDVGRLRLDVSNDSGTGRGRPAQPDSPLMMEEARAVALNVAGRIAG
jgi:hypothetical protein